MKIIIWENLLKWDKSKKGRFMNALFAYLKKSKHSVKNINKKGYNTKDCFEKCDLIVMWGSSNKNSIKIKKDYEKRNIPILVMENGLFDEKHLSFGLISIIIYQTKNQKK